MTQRETILKYLQTHKSGITSKEAIEKFGCTRLSAVISVLRDKGYDITSARETVPTRYGHASVSRYTYGSDN